MPVDGSNPNLQFNAEQGNSVDVPEDINHTVLQAFIDGYNVHETSIDAFDGYTIQDAVRMWRALWNGYVPNGSRVINAEDFQIFYKFVRSYVKRYLSSVVSTDITAEVEAVNRNTGNPSRTMSDIGRNMLEYSEEETNQQAITRRIAIETAVAGTCFVEENYKRQYRTNEVVTAYDPATGEVKKEKRTQLQFAGCTSRIRPIENILFPTLNVNSIQDQEWVIDHEMMHKGEFEMEFRNFDNYDKVEPGQYVFPYGFGSDTQTNFEDKVNLLEDYVHVIKFYRKRDNRKVILANGITLYDDVNPFAHGEYPYAHYIFEPVSGQDFMYGYSFVRHIEGEQDLYNVVFNMLSKKEMWSAQPLIMAANEDEFAEDQEMDYGKVHQVSSISNVRIDQLPGLNGGDTSFLTQLQDTMEQNSGNISGGAQMFSPQGGKVPVRQSLMAEQAAKQQVSWNTSFLEDGEAQRKRLRLYNVRQFYTIPATKRIVGEDHKLQDVREFSQIRKKNVKLDDGQTGTRYIRVYDEQMKQDEIDALKDALDTIEQQGENKGEPTEAKGVSIQAFDRFDFLVNVIPGSAQTNNKALEQAQRVELAQFITQMIPRQVDRVGLVRKVLESTDINVEEILGDVTQQQPAAAQQAQQGQGGGDQQSILSSAQQRQIQAMQAQGQAPTPGSTSEDQPGAILEQINA